MQVHGHEVRGREVDSEARCDHYSTALDIVAIKLVCCGHYYPCFRCHEETTDHNIEKWPLEHYDNPAVLCGNCGRELTVQEYVTATVCPVCEAPFNPGCTDHYHRYFEGVEKITDR